jgi:integrase
MLSIKVILKKNKVKKDGSFPLYLRLIKGRDSKFITLGINLFENQWDQDLQRVKKNHPNSVRINNLISKKKADAEADALEIIMDGKSFKDHSFNEIKGRSKTDFFKYAQQYIDNLLATDKIGTHRRAKYTIEKLKTYHKNATLDFNDFSVSFLKSYQEHLVSIGNKVNTIHSNFKLIRTIFNNAVNENLVKRDKNPFYSFKLKSEETNRAYLTESEIYALDNLELQEQTKINDHRNMYVFATYVGGLRISDLLQIKWSNFDGTHLSVKTKKTGSQLNIKIPSRGLEILNHYTQTNVSVLPNDFIFPVLPSNFDDLTKEAAHKIVVSKTALINKNLKIMAERLKINKNISFHTSRHTFATRALRKGISIDKVSKLLTHSSIRETMGYAKIVNEELDKAMDVFNL